MQQKLTSHYVKYLPLDGKFISQFGYVVPNVAKAGGLRSQASRLKLSRKTAGPQSPDNSESEAFRLFRKGKQHGKIVAILRIHLRGYPKINGFAVSLVIIIPLAILCHFVYAILGLSLPGANHESTAKCISRGRNQW